MANNKEILPKGEYKIKTVGPTREWDFSGNNGKVEMATDSVQFEGHEQYWVDVNRKRDSSAPTEGQVLKGHIEQDEEGKFPPKFKKESGGGGFGGGRGASAGAIWSSAVDIAVNVVNSYVQISGKKPKDIDEYLTRVEQVAPKINEMVDRLAGKAKSDSDNKPATESGESAGKPAAKPAEKKADVVVEDINDEELGDW